MRIVLGGDTMLGRLVDIKFAGSGLSPLAAIARTMRDADLTAVNLECAITDGDTWYTGPPKAFYFRAGTWAADALADAGIDVVSLANNHALDAGEPGLLDTLRHLDAHGIAHAGAGATLAEASQPALLERHGARFALLSFCDHQDDFAAGPERPGIRLLDLTDLALAERVVREDVAAARLRAPIVIVAFHWQPNWAPQVEPAFRQTAHAAVAAGAAVVWGHSPHHFQGVELFGDAAILYSTGDLVDDYAVDPDFRNDRQLLFALELNDGRVTRVEALPLVLALGETRPAEGEAKAWIEATFRRFCAPFGSRVHEERGWLVVTR